MGYTELGEQSQKRQTDLGASWVHLQGGLTCEGPFARDRCEEKQKGKGKCGGFKKKLTSWDPDSLTHTCVHHVQIK